ncbi:hypothetical protein G4B88_028941 [Cannabis sativa]|uniref:Uncharacterized protein n=1 Tax=Cannabis sativa TaxID=3483 RepID=A0A7J6HMY2_CANSA|nr:hypothetical protein G4B88_028941 [Cannabis sativa]
MANIQTQHNPSASNPLQYGYTSPTTELPSVLPSQPPGEWPGIRGDLETSTTPMDVEPETAGVTDMVSQGGSPMPDENQKQSSDTDAGPEMGQLEADSKIEAGIIEGEVDLDAAS